MLIDEKAIFVLAFNVSLFSCAPCSLYEVLYLIHSYLFRLRPPGRKTPPIRKQTKVQMPRSVNMEKVRSQSFPLEVSSIFSILKIIKV